MRTPRAEVRGSRPPTRVFEHWFVLAAAVIALICALGLQGYARHEIGRASTRGTDHSPAASGFDAAGPIIDLSQPDARTLSVPPKTVALTFDDGPDPRWTPKVLDVLERHDVHATFFVVGSHVTSYPELVRRMLREGHDVGNHTFTHIDLLTAPAWQAKLELRLTEVALAAAGGRHSLLLRPPYSSQPDAVRQDTLAAWRRAAGGRYLIVLSTKDSDDWLPKRTAAEIEAASLPSAGAGAIVLMHDGGGNRTNTVAALEGTITTLQQRGYKFVTVNELARLPRARVMPSVTGTERIRSDALPLALRVSSWVTSAFTVFALLAAMLALVRAVLLVAFARRHAKTARSLDPPYAPRVSIVVPAYNEALGIEAAVRSLARSDYADFEVIVVDDGSTDDTLARLHSLVASEGLSGVEVMHQSNAGKARALNAGLARATGDVIVTVDGDTVFEPDTLGLLVQQLGDERVGAVSGNTKVANRKGLLGRWQHVEYVMGFNLDRRMYHVLGCMPTVPGAIGAFRARALADVGGFSDDTLAEDTDITMALHRAGWEVAYEPLALAWTEAPSRARDLWRQRYRWSYGTMQSAWKHKGAALESGDGRRFGLVGLPYLLAFQVALPLFGPAVDVFTLYGLIFLDLRVFLLYWLVFTALQMAVAAYALRLDRESYRPLWSVPLQQFVYRQLMYLVVIQSISTALAGTRVRWQKIRRTGHASRAEGRRNVLEKS